MKIGLDKRNEAHTGMKRKEAERIIKAEKLISYSFFEDRNDTSDEMVIKKISGKWIVYATNERASKIISGENVYDNEEDALDNFIERLRALNNVIRHIENWRRER